ncbi:MAG: VWA domain-containing protein [Polyangiaceae bacterium]
MTPVLIAKIVPWLALVATLAVTAFFIAFAAEKSLRKRFLLIGATLLGVLPLVYTELAWTHVISERYLRLNHPQLSVLTAIAMMVVSWRLAAMTGRQHPFRRAMTELMLSLAVLTAGFASLSPELGRPLDKLTVLMLLDRSRSIDLVPGAEQLIRAQLNAAERTMRDDDRIGLIVFGGEAATEDPPRPKSDNRTPQRIEVGRDATDIAAGIRRALAEIPPDTAARLVVVSDGVSTRGDPLDAAAGAVAAEVPIDVLALDQKAVPDVRVVAVRMPARADEKEAMDIRVVTSSSAPAEIEMRLKRDGVLIRTRKEKIEAGEDVLRIREIASSPGLHRYDVEITAVDPKLDQAPEDNSGSGFVRVRGPSAALVLEGDAGKGAFIAKSLTDAGFRVDEASTSGFPADLAGFAGYDVVVLSDIRASDISALQIDALASYARDLGGGLMLMGGDRSMAPGGYAKTSIEEVSPVSFDIKQERRRASLAEVISIDYSGSMGMHVGSVTKLDLANEAAARSAMLLGPSDRLGVAHVDTVNSWTIPLSPVLDPAEVARKIRAVKVGGGGIYVDLAMDEGYKALDAERVNLKHFLLFADGNDAERMTGCRAKVSAALRRGITTSVVALGKGSDVAELEQLAKVGTGRFYLIEDATRLPAVFTQETILAAKSAINEIDFKVATSAPGAATRGIDFSAAPQLKGYVVTMPKARASVHLVGPENDPILATWSVGLGRSAAFTSDLKDRWGQQWTTWPGAARMVSQTARDIARKADDPRVRLESDASGGELHVRATVVGDDGRAQTFRRLAVQVGGPDGFSRKVPLDAVGAGAYAATIPLSSPGTFVATAIDELSNEAVGTTGAVLSAGEELRPTGTDRALLNRVATMTGGKVRDSLDGVFLDRATRRFAYTPLTMPLLIAAAASLLLSVAARKLAWFDGLVAAWAAINRTRRRPEARVTASERHAAETAASLLANKEKAQAKMPAHQEIANQTRPAPMASVASPTPAAAPVVSPRKDAPPPSSRAGRKLTAAEILLEKRRGKRGLSSLARGDGVLRSLVRGLLARAPCMLGS